MLRLKNSDDANHSLNDRKQMETPRGQRSTPLIESLMDSDLKRVTDHTMASVWGSGADMLQLGRRSSSILEAQTLLDEGWSFDQQVLCFTLHPLS